MKNFEKIIIANWKMQLSTEQSVVLAKELVAQLKDQNLASEKMLVICPDFTSLHAVGAVLEGSGIALGAQDGFYEDKGAFTGQVSLQQLKHLGCEYVILGHSERRALGETDKLVNQKVAKALSLGLTPIICVGETFEQRQEGSKGEVIMRQVYEALQGISISEGQSVIIAYEPVWVIGSGQAISGQEAAETVLMIKQSYVDVMEGENMPALNIIYGGSVDGQNIAQFTRQPNIKGALVGGASLQAASFLAVIKNS